MVKKSEKKWNRTWRKGEKSEEIRNQEFMIIAWEVANSGGGRSRGTRYRSLRIPSTTTSQYEYSKGTVVFGYWYLVSLLFLCADHQSMTDSLCGTVNSVPVRSNEIQTLLPERMCDVFVSCLLLFVSCLLLFLLLLILRRILHNTDICYSVAGDWGLLGTGDRKSCKHY